MPLSHGFGLGFAVTSYLDKLTISLTADRKAVPDPEFFEQCIDDSCAAHLAAAAAVLRRHPELLLQASPARRRAHPGMAAMGRLGKEAPKTRTPTRKPGAPSATKRAPKAGAKAARKTAR